MKMKKHICVPVLFLLVIAACNTSGDHATHTQPQTILAPDSLWTPTGDARLDSLLQLVAVAPQDTNLALLYADIGDIYINIDTEQAKIYYRKMGDLNEQLNWKRGHYIYAASFAVILQYEMLIDSAVVILKEALAMAEREKDESWKAILNYNIGNTYNMIRWYETALSYYMEALPFFERENNPRKLAVLFYMMSQLYSQLKDTEKALEYGNKALDLNRKDPYIHYALAVAYSIAYQKEKATIHFEMALHLCELQNNISLKGGIYQGLANIAMFAFDLEKAEEYITQALEINRQFGAYYISLLTFGKIELLKGNYGQSEAYAREALQLATEIEDLEIKRECYWILSELVTAQHKYREVKEYWEEIDLLENEQIKATIVHAFEEMAAKYETEKKQLQIERQQSVIARQNMQRWLFVGGIAVCVVFLALLWYMLRLRNRRNSALTERNNALANMNATKDKFFNIISHDLKNPALAMHDNLKLLAGNVRLWDVDMLSDVSNELLKSSDGQVELLNSLLSWARIQTGRINCTPLTFNLAARLRTDISLVCNLAENKNITFAAQMPAETIVTADANMILTVVRNLLTNAVKFTPAGGTVTLSVKPVGDTTPLPANPVGDSPSLPANLVDDTTSLPANPVDCRDAARHVSTDDGSTSPAAARYTVSISDTGTGMTSEQVENLFRLDKPHTNRGTAGEEGSGLGLIVCKELLEMHGSTLHIESREAQGSRFWFEI
jgi:signal transduction histidine kinase